MLIWDVKLPDHRHPEVDTPWVEAYEVEPRSVRRHDDGAFVADLLMPPGVDGSAIRHYSFPDRAWAANVALDLDGNLCPEFKGRFAFDCDITTPHFEAFGALCNIDLKLDVFVEPDGRTHEVVDHEDFAAVKERGFVDGTDAATALAGLDDLLALVLAGELFGFLSSICPFRSVRDAAEVRIVGRRPDARVLDHWRNVRT